MHLPLADIYRPKTHSRGLLYDVLLVLAGSALIALSAQISFNIGAVPITGQTLGVLLVAALLGSKRGLAAVIAYLIEGALFNMPVFAGGAFGAATLAGPTGGYLLGFMPAAFVVGYLAERGWDRTFGKTVLAMVLGNLIIYLIGAPRLGSLVGWENMLPWGVIPFIPGDVLKILLSALLLPAGWKFVK